MNVIAARVSGKRRYFYGIRVSLVTTSDGIPVEGFACRADDGLTANY
jgi:hypothetical protein